MSRYQEFIANFNKAVLKSNRNIEEIEIIAVSKRKQNTDIQLIIDEGHLSFGENQLQEVVNKWPEIKKKNLKTKLHFIGSIQSKKLSDIVHYCDAIHTIDREKLLPILKRIDNSILQKKDFFVQINTGNEEQKSGVCLSNAEKFLEACKNNEIQVDGLMCLPPANINPSKYFKQMYSLASELSLKELSMGMSSDYLDAVENGATYIRIGSKIFGTRS